MPKSSIIREEERRDLEGPRCGHVEPSVQSVYDGVGVDVEEFTTVTYTSPRYKAGQRRVVSRPRGLEKDLQA